MNFQGGSSGTVIFKITTNAKESQLFDFAKDLNKIAPISTFNSASVTTGRGSSLIFMEISTSWTKLPEKIPAITDPVVDLTPEEKDLLDQLVLLDKPIYTKLDPSFDNTGKDNPFD